jgi:AraC family transcriptional regulator
MSDHPRPPPQVLEAECDAIRVRIGSMHPHRAGEHRHDEHEIAAPGAHASAVLSYRAASKGTQQVRLSHRHVALIPAGLAHALDWQAPAALTTIMVRPAFLQALAAAHGAERHALAGQLSAIDPFMWHFARTLERQLQLWGTPERAYLDSIAVVIGQHLLSHYGARTSAPPAGCLPHYKTRRAIDYIQSHYQEDIGFRDIALHLGMSPYHFARLFTQATGQSPHQFIMRCRIDAAKKMLTESQRSIADIAAEVGYKSQSYFSTRFALLAGMPPVVFRACH